MKGVVVGSSSIKPWLICTPPSLKQCNTTSRHITLLIIEVYIYNRRKTNQSRNGYVHSSTSWGSLGYSLSHSLTLVANRNTTSMNPTSSDYCYVICRYYVRSYFKGNERGISSLIGQPQFTAAKASLQIAMLLDEPRCLFQVQTNVYKVR
jgi:hypothetical protein